jgi:hypothetical protein
MSYPIQAPNSAAAALAAASVSLILTSAAENMEQWYSEDESELHEAMMLGEVLTFVTGPSCNQVLDPSQIPTNCKGATQIQ